MKKLTVVLLIPLSLLLSAAFFVTLATAQPKSTVSKAQYEQYKKEYGAASKEYLEAKSKQPPPANLNQISQRYYNALYYYRSTMDPEYVEAKQAYFEALKSGNVSKKIADDYYKAYRAYIEKVETINKIK